MRLERLTKTIGKFGLLWPAVRKFNDDSGFFLSSGIAFNILINLIPFVMMLMALIGAYLYDDREVLLHIQAYVRDVAPAADPKVTKALVDVIESRRVVGIVGFLALLWFSSWVFSSLRIALNIVFRVERPRRMLWGMAVDLLMTLVVGALLLVSMILSSGVAVLESYRGWLPVAVGPSLQWILKYLVPLILSYCMFLLIYKIVPATKVHLTSALQAALFAGVLWEAAKHAFGWYVIHLAKYSVFYGSLSAVVIVVLWVYYSSMILLVGGEFACCLEEARRKPED